MVCLRNICVNTLHKGDSIFTTTTTTTTTTNNNNNNREISQCCGIKQFTQAEKFTANRSDIIIKNKQETTCTLIYVAIPADRNVVQKDAENS
jgi:hypothetical protein